MSKSQSMFAFADPPDSGRGRRDRPVEPDPGENAYAELAVEVPLRETFLYHVPKAMRDAMRPGVRVRVPFGGRRVVGYFLRTAALDEVRALRERGVAVRDVVAVLDKASLLDPTLVALARWMADRYRCSLGEAMAAMVPAGVKRHSRAERVPHVALTRDEAETLARADGLAEGGQGVRKSPRQAQVLRALVDARGRRRLSQLLLDVDGSRSLVTALEKKGLVRVVQIEAEADPLAAYAGAAVPALAEPPTPTPAQAMALAAVRRDIRARRHGVHLLHGVTGSGKTEIYLRAIGEVVGQGRSAIVLVPEISLTPQTAERFRARFRRVALLHSHLTEGQRADAWRRIAAGEVDVVIGARSALFAPLHRPGLIVLDEEHETTYKQETVPRYHARDTARVRARLSGAVLLLGSATPSLETAALAARGAANRLTLPARVAGRPLPPVEIVDMRDENRKRFTVLSLPLRRGIERSLARGEQVILFINRRGFATYIHCARCGFLLTCDDCDVSMTFHRQSEMVLCHYCGREAPPPADCPDCGLKNILYHGTGTERIEQVVAKRFPNARIGRMDSDAMRERGAYVRVLGAFGRGETDILVGTQMIAKGLDFPNVTLVGIVKADMALNLADFRASERTFQLIAQVAGRTGRGEKGGRVIVQTWMPDNVAVTAAAAHDYETFAHAELIHRREWGYPPFTHLARVIVRGKKQEQVRARAEAAQGALAGAWTALAASDPITDPEADPAHESVFPSAACPIGMIKGEHRMHVLARAFTPARLARRLKAAAEELDRTVRGVQLAVDVDPVSML